MTQPPPEDPPPDDPSRPAPPAEASLFDDLTEPLRLHVHVNEPWDFERENGVTSMVGWTVDHLDPENVEWEVALEQSFLLHEEPFDRVLVSPRYVGEGLSRVVEDFVTASIRIALLLDNEESGESEWHYVMTGTLAHQRDEKKA
jgi:hypothetical protein